MLYVYASAASITKVDDMAGIDGRHRQNRQGRLPSCSLPGRLHLTVNTVLHRVSGKNT